MMNLVLRKVESLSGRMNSINVEWLHLLYIYGVRVGVRFLLWPL